MTVNLWSRLRWPTELEAFYRPVRWVVEGQHSHFFGGPQAALGFEYLTKRVRLVGRYVFGLNVHGFSVGLGISF